MGKLGALFGVGRRNIDMTQGNIVRLLINFTIPLLMGNLFQQLYNLVDSWVVGNYVSNEAFAAVGTVGPIINVLIYCFTGLAAGAGVLISQYYGARQEENVRRAVHTFVVLTLILSVAFSIVGIVLTPTFLKMMGTVPSVMPESTAYLKIYFAGISGLFIYNMSAGIMRAVGDSRRPFLYLTVCTLLNIILDLLFVLKFHMGVEGVAYATMISQGVSAILGVATLLRSDSWVRISLRQLRIHPDILRRILNQGLPAAMQMGITSFSSIFVQSYIYQFGADVMSGWAAYGKINSVAQMAIQSMGTAASTFVGQNVGRGDLKRAKKGLWTAVAMTVGLVICISVVLTLVAPSLIAFFNDKPEVVEYGSFVMRLMSAFYFIFGVSTVCSASIRGSGNARVSMIIILSSYVGFRQVYLFIVSNFISNTLLPLALAVPLSWVVAAAASIIYLKKRGLQGKMVQSASKA